MPNEYPLTLPAGTRCVHAAIDLRGPVPLFVRGVLVVLLDAGVLGLLWFVAELVRGAPAAAALAEPGPLVPHPAGGRRSAPSSSCPPRLRGVELRPPGRGGRAEPGPADHPDAAGRGRRRRRAGIERSAAERPPARAEPADRRRSRALSGRARWPARARRCSRTSASCRSSWIRQPTTRWRSAASSRCPRRLDPRAGRAGRVPGGPARAPERHRRAGDAAARRRLLAGCASSTWPWCCCSRRSRAWPPRWWARSGPPARSRGRWPSSAARRWRSGEGSRCRRRSEQPPLEFEPVFGAFERMAADIRVSQSALEEARRRTAAVLATVATGVVGIDPAGPRADRQPAGRGSARAPSWRRVSRCSTGSAPSGPARRAVRRFLGRSRRRRQRRAGGRAAGGSRSSSPRSGPEVRGVVIALNDVTDVSRAERVLAWGEMARQVAHEIKNPLTPMRLGLQHLRRVYRDRRDRLRPHARGDGGADAGGDRPAGHDRPRVQPLRRSGRRPSSRSTGSISASRSARWSALPAGGGGVRGAAHRRAGRRSAPRERTR